MRVGQPGGFDTEKNELNKNTSKYFTIGAFMIDANEIINVEKRVKDIKIKLLLYAQYYF